MKAFIFVVLFSTLITGRAHAADVTTPCPRDNRPLHFIALVHGLAANGTTFGAMDVALEKHLSEEDPQFNFCVTKFVYPTGNDKYGLYDFARMLGDFITLKVGKAASDDKISLVGHSEGGLISLFWIQQAFKGNPLAHPEYKPNFAKLITLSTPFWGSAATVVGEFVKSHPLVENHLNLHFGALELEDLSFGSQTIWGLFKKLTDPQFLKTEEELFTKVKILTLGGEMELREDDAIVPVASSRLGAILAADPRTDYSEGDMLGEDKFSVPQIARDFIVVRAVHAIRLEPYLRLPSIAEVKEVCIQNENCQNPSFKYILDFLTGRPVVELKKDLLRRMTLRNFILEANIVFPDERIVDPRQVTIAISKIGNDPVKIAGDELNPGEPYIFKKKVRDPNPKYLEYRVEAAGALVTTPEGDVELAISSPGYKTRYATVPVRGGYTTLLELHLAPLTPVPQ